MELQVKKFLPCVIYIDERQGQVYGSEKNKNQGIELIFQPVQETTEVEKKNHQPLQLLRLKGFVEDYTISPSCIQRITCRFIREGKCTFFLVNQHKILISKISESMFYSLVNSLLQTNPSVKIVGHSETCLSAQNARSINPIYLCRQKAISLKNSLPFHEDTNHKSSRHVQSFPLQAVCADRKRFKAHSLSTTPSLTSLRGELLSFLFYEFGVVSEMFTCCRFIANLIQQRRHVLRVRAVPRDTWIANQRYSLTQGSTLFSERQLLNAVNRSPYLRVLDCTSGVLLTANAFEALLAKSSTSCVQLEGLSLRCHGRIADSMLRKFFFTQRRLKRVNLTNLSCNYQMILEPFFHPAPLNANLELLWIGKIPIYPTSSPSVCLTFLDDSLNRLLGQPRIHSCDPMKIHLNQHPPLLSLSLANCGNIQKPLCLHLVGSTLIELDLRGTSITDDVGAQLSTSLPRLKYLNVSCTLLGDNTLKALLLSCPLLEKLDLSNLRDMAQEHPQLLQTVCTSWPALKLLSLADNKFSCDIISHLLQHPKLLALNLSRCLHLLPEHFLLPLVLTPSERLQNNRILQVFIKDSSLTRRSIEARLRPYNIIVSDSTEKQFFDVPNVSLVPN